MSALRRQLRRRLADERGFALVLAIAIMVVLGISVTAVIDYTNTNRSSTQRTKMRVTAYTVAEAGISNVMSVLNNTNAFSQSALCANWNTSTQTCVTPLVFTFDASTGYPQFPTGSTATINASFNTGASLWTVSSTGSLPNPTGGTTTQTIQVEIHVHADPTQAANSTAWNYVFAYGNDGNPSTCDVDLRNGVVIDTSFYVAGDLCLEQTSQIVQPAGKSITLTILGKLALEGTKGVGQSGTPSTPIDFANIGLGCTSNIVNAGHTCNPASPTNDYFYVGAGGYSASPQALTVPQMTDSDWQYWYNNAAPGPKHPCDTMLGQNSSPTRGNLPLASPSAAPTFDNDGTLNFTNYPNGSVPTAFNLTPSTNYSCVATDAWGSVTGYLAWNATTHTLYVRGVIYFDGSVYMSNQTVNAYTGVDHSGIHQTDGSDGSGGMATIYVSGTFSMNNGGTRLCGWNTTNDTAAISGSSCSFSNWTPLKSMILFVVHGNDGLGNSVVYQGGVSLEGGIYATNAIDLGNSSSNEGPILAKGVKATNSVTLNPLPSLNSLPLGAPGNPNTHAVPEPPVYTSSGN